MIHKFTIKQIREIQNQLQDPEFKQHLSEILSPETILKIENWKEKSLLAKLKKLICLNKEK
jgi:hypothetical protein